ALDHHSLLLRRHDHEGNRRDARSERVARQPDAFEHRGQAAIPACQTPTGIQQLTELGLQLKQFPEMAARPLRQINSRLLSLSFPAIMPMVKRSDVEGASPAECTEATFGGEHALPFR